MPTETSVASSPAPAAPAAQTSDAKKTGPGNLSMAAASAQMFARQVEAAKKPATPPPTATAETAPAKAEQTGDASVAEAAQAASSDTPTDTTETQQSEAAQPSDDGQAASGEDEGGDDVLSPKSSLDDYHKAKVQKRIDKERAKRGVLEAQIKERDAKIAALEMQGQQRQRVEAPAPSDEQRQPAPRTVQVPANVPLAEVNDTASLSDLRKQAKEAIRFVEDTLETPRAWKERMIDDPENPGSEIKVRTTKLGDQELTEDQLRAVRRQAKLTLEDHIPAREQYLAARAQTQQLAQQKFAFLRDKQSPEYQQVRQFLSNSWAQQNPHSEWIAAVYVKGLKAIEAEEAKSAAPAASKPKTVLPVKTSTDQTATAASGSAARVPIGTGARQQLAASEEKVKAKHGITAEDAKQQLLNRERFRNSP
jgi:hypothetical protein